MEPRDRENNNINNGDYAGSDDGATSKILFKQWVKTRQQAQTKSNYTVGNKIYYNNNKGHLTEVLRKCCIYNL